MPSSCALLGGFAIGARFSLLWQHSANAKLKRVLVLALCLVLFWCRRSVQSIFQPSDSDLWPFDKDVQKACSHNRYSCNYSPMASVSKSNVVGNTPVWYLISESRTVKPITRNAAATVPARHTSALELIMAALHSRCGHYIFALWFLSIFLHLSARHCSGALDTSWNHHYCQ